MARYGATTLPLNQWVHVAGVYDAAAQTMTVYLNGVPDNGTLSGTVAARQTPSVRNVLIGQRADSNGFGFLGTLDEVRIYNRALGQAEIQADMNAAVAPPAPDAVAPSAPTNPAVSAMSTTQLHVQWANSSDNFDVTGYRVERCRGGGCADFAEIAAVNNFKFDDSGLALATSYSYRVRAIDSAGNFSGYSSVVTLATLTSNPTGGRVGIYPFDEGSGTTTADFSGFGNNGTLNSSVHSTAAGKYGNAFSFTGGYVDLGNPGTLQITGSMTISAWINSASFPVNDAAIVSKLIISPGAGWQMDTTVNTGPRTLGFKLANPSGALMARYGATTLQLNQWYHVAGVYDAQAQTLNVYLNGQLDNGTLVGTVTPSQLDAVVNLAIGKRLSLNGYEFYGTIDDVRIYNRALSQAEVQADMAVAASTPVGDTTPPTAPSALSATAAGASQINLAWTASTDNVGVVGYRVERCQGAGCSTFAQIATPVATTFSDAGLVGSTSYSYRVRAADIAGNLSGYSNVASATTASAQGQMYFIHPDHLNTPRSISDQAGNEVWRWDNTEPFGDSVPNDDPGNTGNHFEFPLGLSLYYTDKETGQRYAQLRDCYDPVTGRFCESDPIGLMGGLNTFLYVGGNPTIYTDPLGLQSRASKAISQSKIGKALKELPDTLCDYWPARCVKDSVICLEAKCTRFDCQGKPYTVTITAWLPPNPPVNDVGDNCICTRWTGDKSQ